MGKSKKKVVSAGLSSTLATMAAVPGRVSLALPTGCIKLVDEFGTPYYLNETDRTSQYVDPRVDELLRSLSKEFRWIRLAAYRTSAKIRALQHFSALSVIRVDELFNCFRAAEMEIPGIHDPTAILSPETMSTILLQVYARTPHQLARVETMVSFLLLCYDRHRSGGIPLQSFQVGLTLLTAGWCEEKFRLLFEIYDTDNDGYITCVDMGRLLVATSRLLEAIDEAYAFFPGNAAVDAAVDECHSGQLEFVGSGELIGLEAFVEWALEEPDSICWIPNLHRMAAAETEHHDVKCSNSACAMYPIIGFRYERGRDSLCQFCFWNRDRDTLRGTSDHEWIEHCYPTKKRTSSKAKQQKQLASRRDSARSTSRASRTTVPSARDWLGVSPGADDRPRAPRSSDGAAATATGPSPPLPLPSGRDTGSAQRLDELRAGINEVAGTLAPTRLSNGDPTAALFSLASGFDEEQKRHLLRVIDELDNENQTLLRQLTMARDAAMQSVQQVSTTAVASPSVASVTSLPQPHVPVMSEAEQRAQAAAALATIEEELAESMMAGVRLRSPVPHATIAPLAAATASVAAELRAYANDTILGPGGSTSTSGWPSASRNDSITNELRNLAVGLRIEPAVVFGDVGITRATGPPVPTSTIPDEESHLI